MEYHKLVAKLLRAGTRYDACLTAKNKHRKTQVELEALNAAAKEFADTLREIIALEVSAALESKG